MKINNMEYKFKIEALSDVKVINSYIKDEITAVVNARSYISRDIDAPTVRIAIDEIVYDYFMRNQEGREYFYTVLIHELCEAYLMYVFMRDGIPSIPSVTHYMTTIALDEPLKDVVLPWENITFLSGVKRKVKSAVIGLWKNLRQLVVKAVHS